MPKQLVGNTDLTTTGVSAGTYGNSAYHPVVTVGTDGRVTSVTNTVITISTNASDITVTGNVTANSIIPTSTAKPQNGIYLAAANSLGFSANSIASFSVDANGSLNLSKSYTNPLSSAESKYALNFDIFLLCRLRSEVFITASIIESISSANADVHQSLLNTDSCTPVNTCHAFLTSIVFIWLIELGVCRS